MNRYLIKVRTLISLISDHGTVKGGPSDHRTVEGGPSDHRTVKGGPSDHGTIKRGGLRIMEQSEGNPSDL